MNFNIAEACAYFPQSWIKDGIYTRSCPPKCTHPKKVKGRSEKTNKDEVNGISQIDMGDLLSKLGDTEHLEMWNARPGWLTNHHKKYNETDCPSYKEMQDRHIFDDMENIVNQMRNGKF